MDRVEMKIKAQAAKEFVRGLHKVARDHTFVPSAVVTVATSGIDKLLDQLIQEADFAVKSD